MIGSVALYFTKRIFTRSGSSRLFLFSSYHFLSAASSTFTASASFFSCANFATFTVKVSVMSASAWSSSIGEAQVADARTAWPTRISVVRRLRNASKRSGVSPFWRSSAW